MNQAAQDAQRQLLVNSRRDALHWLGRNADALAEVAYATSVSGGALGVHADILITEADRYRAHDLLTELRDATPDDDWSDEMFFVLVRTAVDFHSTFDIRFHIERTTHEQA